MDCSTQVEHVSTGREYESTADLSKQIRAEYKRRGWGRNEVSVRSSNYSMGSSIRVEIKSPKVHRAEAERVAKGIAEHIDRDQWGEILSGGNRFVFVDHTTECLAELGAPYLDAVKAAFAKCGNEYGTGYDIEGVPGAFVMLNGPYDADINLDTERFRINSYTDAGVTHWPFEQACGFLAEYLKGEYKPEEPKPPTQPGPAVRGEGYEVKDAQNKRGAFALVVLAERVERAEFEQLRDSAKAAGGWYSRAWRGQSGGFGFDNAEQAKAWASSELGEPVPDDGTPRPNATADRLDTLADNLTAEIEHKRAPLTQNWTRRRGAQKDNARKDADTIEYVQNGLRAIAQALRAGNLPGVLAQHLTKAAVTKIVQNWSGDYSTERGALLELIQGNTTAEQKAAAAERAKAAEIEALENEARTRQIPGFFPTPKPVIDEMLTVSGVRLPGKRLMLEPSAGLGHIVFAALEANPDLVIDAVEIIPKACEIIRAKGFDSVSCADFLEAETGSAYDLVLMNPPFERGSDLVHVRKAAGLLGPSGRLVSVMTERSAQAAVEELGGYIEQLPQGSFNGAAAFRSTGVSTVLYILDE